MARAIWSGTVSFGLVSIPVRLFNATSPKDVRFHQFEAGTGRRIRYRRVAPRAEAVPFEWGTEGEDAEAPGDEVAARRWDEGAFEAADRDGDAEAGNGGHRPQPPDAELDLGIPFERVVKGFEVDPGRHVLVTREELDALAPEQTRTIEIEDFVDLADIDPLYFEKSYYVAPQRGAEKPYRLLVRAMTDAGKVGVARFVLRSKEHLAAIRPVGEALVLETLFFADEVRRLEEVGLPPSQADVSERELEMARRLIVFLATTWEPDRYQDTYRRRVLELIEAKLGGREVVVEEQEARPAVPDLMAALRESVEAARARRERASEEPA